MINRRDVVLAQVFFTDSSESKVRPAIVLSEGKYHSEDFVLVASVTTANDNFCIPILKNDVTCALDENSHARFDGVIKLHKKQILRTIGRISAEFHAGLVDKIINMINYKI
ncbi:MAG: type II toxin-antitoxin system PemK/MazF family toxin [Candidatus Micrarchaeota archaeon]